MTDEGTVSRRAVLRWGAVPALLGIVSGCSSTDDGAPSPTKPASPTTTATPTDATSRRPVGAQVDISITNETDVSQVVYVVVQMLRPTYTPGATGTDAYHTSFERTVTISATDSVRYENAVHLADYDAYYPVRAEVRDGEEAGNHVRSADPPDEIEVRVSTGGDVEVRTIGDGAEY